MKKRIVALLLVLVLAVAMMVPVFAAPSACPNGCNRFTPYEYGDTYCVNTGHATMHAVYQYVSYICASCAYTTTVGEYRYNEGHSYAPGSLYCVKCNYYRG